MDSAGSKRFRFSAIDLSNVFFDKCHITILLVLEIDVIPNHQIVASNAPVSSRH